MVEDIELDLLLEGVYRGYGVDLRGCPRARLRPVIRELMQEAHARTVTGLLDSILHDDERGRQAALALGRGQVSLFADPVFFAAFRERVIPWLRTYPFSSIWALQAGNAGDVYSLAILLLEAGLYERTRIYATHDDAARLPALEDGGLAPASLAASESNYRSAGGAGTLRDHFELREGQPVVATAVRRNIVWSEYDVARGETFNEFQMILCRDLIARSDSATRLRLYRLVTESLSLSGVLALGPREKPDVPAFAARYRTWDDAAGLHQRIG